MTPQTYRQPPASLAERFWSLARAREEHSSDPVDVVRHVLHILDALDAGESGADLTVNTVSFLALLRQSEAKGDMQYASPEQARGETLDERSLVFSAGVLIFEKLTGRHPFGAEANPLRLARIRRAEMASGVSYFQTISGPLRTILLRCMGPFPQDRWNSLAELRAELEAFANGEAAANKKLALPALPANSPGHESPPVPKRRFARASSWALGVAADRESQRRDQSVADLPAAVSGSWLGRATWMLAGGAIASAAFLLAGAGRDGGAAPPSASPSLSPTVASPVAAIEDDAPKTTPQVAPAVAPMMDTESAAATPVAGKDDASSETAVASPVVADRSPESIGDIALLAARDCFAAGRLQGGLEVGVSMHLVPNRETARVFFGRTTLETSERACLKGVLNDASRGAAPAKPTTIGYSFFFATGDGRVRTRVKE